MNDGDRLIALQNEVKIIELLAAQRQLYSDAKVAYIVHGALSIGIPAVATVFPCLSAIVQVVSVVMPIVLGRFLVNWASSRQVEAASVLQDIDGFLFGMEFPHTGFDRGLAARRSISHIEKRGREGLVGWYPDRIRGLAAGKAEFVCQGINIAWTRNLSIVALLLDLTIVIFAIVVSALGIQRSGSDSLAYLLLVPIVDWFVETLLDRRNLYCLTTRIENSRKDLGNDTAEAITKVQELIFVYRCSRPVPNFLYGLTWSFEQRKADSYL